MANNKSYTTITFQVPNWYKDKIKEEAEKKCQPTSAIIRIALNQYFENQQKQQED